MLAPSPWPSSPGPFLFLFLSCFFFCSSIFFVFLFLFLEYVLQFGHFTGFVQCVLLFVFSFVLSCFVCFKIFLGLSVAIFIFHVFSHFKGIFLSCSYFSFFFLLFFISLLSCFPCFPSFHPLFSFHILDEGNPKWRNAIQSSLPNFKPVRCLGGREGEEKEVGYFNTKPKPPFLKRCRRQRGFSSIRTPICEFRRRHESNP